VFETVSGMKIPYEVVERRNGDISQSWANTSLSEQILNWKPRRTLNDMCESALNWQKKNPKGFDNTVNNE